MSWFVYIVECADESYYTGITTDLERRLNEHNSGKGAKYTRSRRPCILVESRQMQDRSSALKLEAFIKRQPRILKRKAIIEYEILEPKEEI